MVSYVWYSLCIDTQGAALARVTELPQTIPACAWTTVPAPKSSRVSHRLSYKKNKNKYVSLDVSVVNMSLLL